MQIIGGGIELLVPYRFLAAKLRQRVSPCLLPTALPLAPRAMVHARR